MAHATLNNSAILGFFNSTAFHAFVVILIISAVLVAVFLVLRNMSRLFWWTIGLACALFVLLLCVNVATLSLENTSEHWSKTCVVEVQNLLRAIFVPIEAVVFHEVKLDEL